MPFTPSVLNSSMLLRMSSRYDSDTPELEIFSWFNEEMLAIFMMSSSSIVLSFKAERTIAVEAKPQ